MAIPGGSAAAYVTADAWLALQAARHAEHGVLPLSGGWLEQTACGLAALEAARHDLDLVRRSVNDAPDR